MTSAFEPVIIECPHCETLYEDWFRPSVNRWLDPCDDESLDRLATFTCPHCQSKARLGLLISDAEGLTFQIPEARYKFKDSPVFYQVRVDAVPVENRLQVMLVIRAATQLGLSKVKNLLENLPQVVMEDRRREKMETLKQELEAAGARVTLRFF